jgi:hypothetical protein
MHDLVIGFFMNRNEFGRAIYWEINTFDTSSAVPGRVGQDEYQTPALGTHEIVVL